MMERHFLVLAGLLVYAVHAAALAKPVEHEAVPDAFSAAQIDSEHSSGGHEEPRERVLQANDSTLVVWFSGEDSVHGHDAWLALVWSVEQCRPLRFLVALESEDSMPDAGLPSIAELKSSPKGFQSIQKVRWKARRVTGPQLLELDVEMIEETVREIYDRQPELVELRLLGANSDQAAARAVFLVEDFRKWVDHLRWRCIDKSGWTGD